MNGLLPLFAESVRSGLRWHHLPPAWMLALVIVPAIAFLAWFAYRRETDVPMPGRVLLASLRGAAILFFLLVLFGPYAELNEMRTVRSHLVVLVDQSQSMATVDGYEPEDARALAKAAGLNDDGATLAAISRIELAKRVLSNPESQSLESWTKDFRLHVFAFGAQATPLISTGESTGGPDVPDEVTPADQVRKRLAEIQATDASTRIGQAVATICDTFKVRDEPVAGIVVISDGQDNGTTISPELAGRKAAAMHTPVFAVGVGDPRSPRNIHVGNLRAKEVVLAKDDAAFEFTVHAKGFEGRRAKIEMLQREPGGKLRPLDCTPSEIVLEGGPKDQQVKIVHRFVEPGLITVRVGVPVQPEEKIKSDNYAEHTIRVIDRKIKVLYVDGYPRWEFGYLSNALIRDRDTMLAHTLLLDADPDTPQRRTAAADWPALDASRGLPPRDKLFDYDVIILGDVDCTQTLGPTEEKRKEALLNIRDFVDKGGGLVMLSGPVSNPTKYKYTDLQGLLPVVLDPAAEASDPRIDTTEGFAMKLTPEGEASPIMNVAGEAPLSKQYWETDPRFRQYWCYPALRAKTLAKVLAVSAHPLHQDPRHGPRPVIATMLYGRGRVLWIGVDQLYLMRKESADRFFYRFYGEAVRFLATYKLLGGNKRYKILTDRDQYGVDDPVQVTLDVQDRDYEPSKAASQTVTVQIPPATSGGAPETVELTVPADPVNRGTFRKTILPTRAGEYHIRAVADDPLDEAPEKIFRVVESTVEGRDLLLDEDRLRAMADNSEGGRYLHLAELPSLRPAALEKKVPTDKRDEEVWDGWWTIAIGTALLAAEWLLRKRWHLV